MKLTVHSEEELYEFAKKLLHVLTNLHHANKVKGKVKIEYWMSRAEMLFFEYDITKTRRTDDINIEIETPNTETT